VLCPKSSISVESHTKLCVLQDERVAAMESDPDVELERILYERDLQRTRWLIKAYYRTRIRKLEQHVQHYLHHHEYTARLSTAELEYAKNFFTCIGRCAPLLLALPLRACAAANITPRHIASNT
jgi:hypothetical protein